MQAKGITFCNLFISFTKEKLGRKLGRKLKVINVLWLNQYLPKKENKVQNGKSFSEKLIMLTGNSLLDICEWALNGLRIYLVLQPRTARKMSK